MNLSKFSPWVIGLLEATGFILYTILVGSIMINGNKWFGSMPNILGPMLFLSLFVVSGIISAAFYLFWEKKNFRLAAKIVAISTFWLILFIILLSCLLLVSRP